MSVATALRKALRAALRAFMGGAAGVAACCSCSSPTQVTAPPVNPNIPNVVGDVTFPYQVICDGPKDELALLGELCGDPNGAPSWTPTDAPAGMALVIGPSVGPFLFVFNYLDYRPDPSANVAGEVKYSAYVVLDHDGEDAVSTIDKWQHGESVSKGAVRTQLVKFASPCGVTWVAQGTFVWRSTTIQLAWDGAQGC